MSTMVKPENIEFDEINEDRVQLCRTFLDMFRIYKQLDKHIWDVLNENGIEYFAVHNDSYIYKRAYDILAVDHWWMDTDDETGEINVFFAGFDDGGQYHRFYIHFSFFFDNEYRQGLLEQYRQIYNEFHNLLEEKKDELEERVKQERYRAYLELKKEFEDKEVVIHE